MPLSCDILLASWQVCKSELDRCVGSWCLAARCLCRAVATSQWPSPGRNRCTIGFRWLEWCRTTRRGRLWGSFARTFHAAGILSTLSAPAWNRIVRLRTSQQGLLLVRLMLLHSAHRPIPSGPTTLLSCCASLSTMLAIELLANPVESVITSRAAY